MIVAVARDAEVGIDIEAIRPLANALAIAERYFSPAERTVLHGLTPSARLTAFFECWTRKEAFLKALGDGLTRPLDGFDVSMGSGGREPLEIRAEGVVLPSWSLHDLSHLPQYAAAVVVRGRHERVCVEQFTPATCL